MSQPSLVPVLSLRGFCFAFTDFFGLKNIEKLLLFSYLLILDFFTYFPLRNKLNKGDRHFDVFFGVAVGAAGSESRRGRIGVLRET